MSHEADNKDTNVFREVLKKYKAADIIIPNRKIVTVDSEEAPMKGFSVEYI